MTESLLDVLVIGGGIVGAGIARDSAMRGVKIGLAEQHDFAFGTSSRTSRLLHGGVRYLAQGRLGLVRQASLEKRILHQIAPHVAEPQPFIFPSYPGTQWPLWQLRLGVKIYDLLCSGKNLGKSSSLDQPGVLDRVPQLRKKDLKGAVRYFDGLTNDARLVLDTLRSAHNSGGAILNYLKFKNARREGDAWICELEDQLNGKPCALRAQVIINATGPWADGLPHSRVKLRLTKGTHIAVDRHRLPLAEAVVMTAEKRILFAIPWGERVIIGTTDTDYDGDIASVRPQQQEIAYLIEIANSFFPDARLGVADVISTWAGVRPLIADAEGKPSDISRSHQISNPEPFWWDVAGGKLTTYRLMAEQTVNQVVKALKELNKLNGHLLPCRTAQEPLLPAAETDGLSGILPPEFCRRAVEHFCIEEWAVHLDDVMVRRSGWHQYFGDSGNRAGQVAQWMAEILGWSDERRVAEVERYRQVNPKSE